MSDRMKRWLLLITLVLLVLPGIVSADDDGEDGGSFKLEGTWWRVAGPGSSPTFTGPMYVATINRDLGNKFNVAFDHLADREKQLANVGVIRKKGLNEYDFTSIAYFGDGNRTAPHAGTTGAGVCSGTLIQQSDDYFYVDVYCYNSGNPCWDSPDNPHFDPSYCAQLGRSFWNPFSEDSGRLCSPWNPIRIEYRRVPFENYCVPEE